MGTSRSPAELASKLIRAGEAVPAAARAGVSQAAFLVKKSVQAELQAAGVNGGRLRGVGKKGAKVGVSYTVAGTEHPTALIRATGPMHLIESDTKAHEIKAKKAHAINIGGVGPRASAHHPGTRGKHPWAKGVDHAIPLVPEVMFKEQAKSLRRFFS